MRRNIELEWHISNEIHLAEQRFRSKQEFKKLIIECGSVQYDIAIKNQDKFLGYFWKRKFRINKRKEVKILLKYFRDYRIELIKEKIEEINDPSLPEIAIIVSINEWDHRDRMVGFTIEPDKKGEEMPYISEKDREKNQYDSDNFHYDINEYIDNIISHIKENFHIEDREGITNYCISRIIAGSMKPDEGWRYRYLNRAYGTFFSAAAEFYRRLVAPYEDECIKKNGDIPEYKNG